MLNFIISNLGTIVISIILLIIIFFIIKYLYKNKKSGKSLCTGGCSGCPMAGNCHPQMPYAKSKNISKK